ncbi:hypothetical protein BOX15_Mlig004664g2, partial [Macrostomum lignano]
SFKPSKIELFKAQTMTISFFPRQIGLSIVPTVLCLAETCGQRIIFLYTLLYMAKLIAKKHYQVTVGAGFFIGVLIELHIIVTILSLIGQSLFYILLFICFHFFVVVSVMWVILDESVDLQALIGPGVLFDEGLRIFGYCLLPGLATGICSWFLTTIYGIEYLPYYILCISFVQYRVYITDPEIRNTKESKYAAEVHCIIVAIVFVATVFVFLVKHAVMSASLMSLLDGDKLLELFFLISLCGLASNFLGLQQLIKHYIDEAAVALPASIRDPGGLIRDVSLISAALLLTPAMQAHGMRLHFYTGPPAALAAVSAVLLGREAGGSIGLFSRLAGWLCGIIGALAFAAQVFLFPWKIQYSMWDPTLTQRQFASILFATALAPLLFLLLSKRDRSSFGRSSSLKSGYLFAVAFSAFLIAFFYCEWNFYLLGYSPYQVVLLFSCLVNAALLKLPESKLPTTLKSVHLATVATRCLLLATHRLAGAEEREIFPHVSVAGLWLLCLQAVWLLWTLPSNHGFFVDQRKLALPIASFLSVAVLLVCIRNSILASIANSIFDRQLDLAELIVLCLLLCSVLHCKSLFAPHWTAIKLITISSGTAALALGLVRNDIIPFVSSNVRLIVSAAQLVAVVSVYLLAWLNKSKISSKVSWSVILCIGLTCQHLLLYFTVFDPSLVSYQAGIALVGSISISSSFALSLCGNISADKLFKPAVALFACVILLAGLHQLLLPSWSSFTLSLIVVLHQLAACRWLYYLAKSNPDLVQLTQKLAIEELLFNGLLSIAYCLLLLGCWNPLEKAISLALPVLLLAWLGPRSQAPFLIAQLLSCQLAALYSVDFYGIDDLDNSNWWNRLVGLLECALCLGQLPLHFILCSLALDCDNGSSMEDGSGDIASVAEIRWPLVSRYGRIFANNKSSSGSGRLYSSLRLRNDDDLTPLFIALIILPLPVCLIVLMASSLQAVCLSVATLLLGSDFLAENYADFLIDMLRASFASLND